LLTGAVDSQTTVRHRDPAGGALLATLGGVTDPGIHSFATTAQAIAGLPTRYADYARTRGLRGLAVMVLPVRGLAHGVVTLTREQPSEPFDAHDLAAIETCLEYTGLAVEAAIRSAAERATTRFHEEMLGIVGHDLRNPLAAMSVGIELLRARAIDPAGEGVLQRIENSTRRMTTIVDQLLDVTRARLGAGIQIVPRDVDLHALVADVLDEVRLVHGKITFELRGPAVHGCWDPDRLGQVVANLATNAAVYGRIGGPVVVELSQADGCATIAVSNPVRDAPIAPELLKLLFDPFERGRSGDHPGGLGLGLYIVQEIVRAHDGTITVDSVPAGTTFRVSLPVERRAPPLDVGA
jgi:signal transduction histidine kinase